MGHGYQGRGGCLSLLATSLVMVLAANAPGIAAPSITEQLHSPPQASIRSRRDVADQFLLLGKEKIAAGDYPAAIAALQTAAESYQDLGDFAGMGEAYGQLVRIYGGLGQYDQAEQVVRQQLAIARSNASLNDQVLALNNLGTLRLQSGDLGPAQAAFAEGLTIAQAIGSDGGIGLSLSNLGVIAAANGQVDDARKYYEMAADYRIRARDYAGQANTDSNLGDVYRAAGSIREAIGAYRLSLSVARNIDEPYIQLRALDGLIAIYRQRNEPRELTRYLNDRIALTISTGDDWQRLLTLRTLGEIYQDNGEVTAARDAFERALSLAYAMERKQMQAELTNRLIALSNRRNR